MKKLIAVIMIIATVILTTGCTKKEEIHVEPLSGWTETITTENIIEETIIEENITGWTETTNWGN